MARARLKDTAISYEVEGDSARPTKVFFHGEEVTTATPPVVLMEIIFSMLSVRRVRADEPPAAPPAPAPEPLRIEEILGPLFEIGGSLMKRSGRKTEG